LGLDKFLGRREKKQNKLKEISGEIKYKCICGEILTHLKLVETKGKCPKCGEELVKFND